MIKTSPTDVYTPSHEPRRRAPPPGAQPPGREQQQQEGQHRGLGSPSAQLVSQANAPARRAATRAPRRRACSAYGMREGAQPQRQARAPGKASPCGSLARRERQDEPHRPAPPGSPPAAKTRGEVPRILARQAANAGPHTPGSCPGDDQRDRARPRRRLPPTGRCCALTSVTPDSSSARRGRPASPTVLPGRCRAGKKVTRTRRLGRSPRQGRLACQHPPAARSGAARSSVRQLRPAAPQPGRR